jgi:hypothetical protein
MISRAQLLAAVATLVFALDAIDCSAQFGGRGVLGGILGRSTALDDIAAAGPKNARRCAYCHNYCTAVSRRFRAGERI